MYLTLQLMNTSLDKELRVFYWSMNNFLLEVTQMLTAAHFRLLPCALLLVLFCVFASLRMNSYRVSGWGEAWGSF